MKACFGLLSAVAMLATATRCEAGNMYWTDKGSIYRANLDGTDVTQIFQASPTDGRAGWMDIDFSVGKIYFRGWASSTSETPGTGIIRSMNLDGSGIQTVISGIEFGAYGFDLDTSNQTLYYGDHSTGKIYRANYDGSSVTPVLNATGLRHTQGIRVLESANKLYYTNGEFPQVGGFNGIRRADLDGSNTEAIYDQGTTQLLGGYIAFDEANQHLYFSEEETGTIYRMGLDGSNKQVFLSGIPHVLDMAINIADGKIYFTSEFKIQRANLDGTGLEDLVSLTGGRFEKSIVLDTRAVPEPSSVVLSLIGGGIALGAWRRRK